MGTYSLQVNFANTIFHLLVKMLSTKIYAALPLTFDVSRYELELGGDVSQHWDAVVDTWEEETHAMLAISGTLSYTHPETRC